VSETLVRPDTPPAPPPARPRRNWRALIGGALLLLLLVLLPVLVGSQVAYLKLAQYVLIGAVGGIGLTLLVGQAGQLSLAHPFFLLVGAVSYAVLSGEQEEGLIGLGLPPAVGLVGAVVVSGLFGLAFAPVAGRLRGIYLGVASLSLVFLGLYLGQSLEVLTGGTSSGRTPPTFRLFDFVFANSQPAPTILGVAIQKQQRLWYLFLVLAVIAYLLARGAVRSRVGRAWRLVRDNEAAAAAMGVNVVRAKAGAFVVSSAYAGLAGVLTALWLDLVKPDENEFTGNYSLTVAIAFLAIVIIGGVGSVPGAVLGAVVVYGLQQFFLLGANEFGWFADARFGGLTAVVLSAFVYGAAVVLVILFEPGGAAAIGRRILARRRPSPVPAGSGGPTTPERNDDDPRE
jgi:branched-chain amino acid transport system permease protein